MGVLFLLRSDLVAGGKTKVQTQLLKFRVSVLIEEDQNAFWWAEQRGKPTRRNMATVTTPAVPANPRGSQVRGIKRGILQKPLSPWHGRQAQRTANGHF